MKNRDAYPLTSFHWGTYRVEVRNGEVVALHPFEEDPDPSPIGQGYVGVLNGTDRISTPMVRKSWLEGGPGTGGYSPYQGCGVCIVRMDDPAQGPGAQVDVLCADGSTQSGELCTLPMYDADRLIPRGKLVDIPTKPNAA